MAKKKKKTSRSKKSDEPKKKGGSPFWRQVYAFVLVLLALFIFLGGFDAGGSGPIWLFDQTAKLFGFAAFFSPIVVVYWAITKFRTEEHVIPLSKLIGGIAVLMSMAGVFHVFVDPETSSRLAADGTYGGYTGHWLNSIFLGFLSSGTAFVVYMLFLLISVLFTFSIAPQRFVAFIIRLLRRKDRDTDLKQLKVHAKNAAHIEVQENVPVEHHAEPKAPVKLTNFKNTAQKLTAAEDHTALTIQSDPNWKFPGVELLNQKQDKADAGDVQANADTIRETLAQFKIDVEMEGANVGPRVTQFTLKPPTGVKLNKIEALSDNLALDLAAASIRIEAPIPGKRSVGIEVPNVRPATVRMSSVIMSSEWRSMKNPLGFAIGKDIAGAPVTGALDKMPHLLIAGQTGSGKSVMINTLLTSMLFHNSPSDLKLILVDPKQVELTPYNDIPHLLTPVITEPEKCISALKWAVAEMERRLRTMSAAGKRNIADYNEATDERMPYIVIVIDELADLMMMAARDVEALIVRIAQKARAVGIHLVLATQSPRVTVITGLIKANVPARIAFTVAQEVESRIILDHSGAEKLLGMGDMLYLTASMPKPIRVQGAWITDEETKKVTQFLRDQQAPNYDDEVVSQPVQLNGKGGVVYGNDSGGDDMDDSAWEDAVRVVIESRKASTSYLQRRLRIGYSRAARLIEAMEEQGIVGPADGAKPRDILVNSIDEVLHRGAQSSGDEVYDDMPDDNDRPTPVNVRFD